MIAASTLSLGQLAHLADQRVYVRTEDGRYHAARVARANATGVRVNLEREKWETPQDRYAALSIIVPARDVLLTRAAHDAAGGAS